MADPVAGILSLNDKNDSKNLPVWYNEYVNNLYGSLARNYNNRDLRTASGAYSDALASYYPQSSANRSADFYSSRTRDIVNDPNTYLGDYEKIRSGNLESLGGVFKDVLDYGLASEKAKLAAGGYGNTGPSSYDKILSSTRTASNLTPVLSNIYNNLGREATASYGSRVDQNRYLLDLFASDPFGRYANQAALRSINPYLLKLGLTGGAVSGLGNLVGAQGIKGNLSGYQHVAGPTERATAIGQDITSALTGGLYGQSWGSQPGQDTATTMGLIGTAASIYGGSNQYKAPELSQGNAPSWQSAYSNYNPNTSYVNQNPTGGYNAGMSYSQPYGNDAQNQYYQQLLSRGGSSGGGYASGLGVGY